VTAFLVSNLEMFIEMMRRSPIEPDCVCNLCRHKDTLDSTTGIADERAGLDAGSQTPLEEMPRLVPRL
jgi:hypothetical protein